MPRGSVKPAANHLRAWREFRKLSQTELAEKVGTVGNVIGHLEAGERGLSDKWLYKLAPALGTSPGFLLQYAPGDPLLEISEAAAQVDPKAHEQLMDILRTFKKAR